MRTGTGSHTRRYRVIVRCEAERCNRTHVRLYGAPRKNVGAEMTIAAPCPYCGAANGTYTIVHVRKIRG